MVRQFLQWLEPNRGELRRKTNNIEWNLHKIKIKKTILPCLACSHFSAFPVILITSAVASMSPLTSPFVSDFCSGNLTCTSKSLVICWTLAPRLPMTERWCFLGITHSMVTIACKSSTISRIRCLAASMPSLGPLSVTFLDSTSAARGNEIVTPPHSSLIRLMTSPRLATKCLWCFWSTSISLSVLLLTSRMIASSWAFAVSTLSFLPIIVIICLSLSSCRRIWVDIRFLGNCHQKIFYSRLLGK